MPHRLVALAEHLHVAAEVGPTVSHVKVLCVSLFRGAEGVSHNPTNILKQFAPSNVVSAANANRRGIA